MSLKNVRLEVMKFLENDVESLIEKYLIPVENIWQPTDFCLIQKAIRFLKR